MDGATAQCELTASCGKPGDGVRFEVATRAYDAAIRQLFRETPMHGRISLSMEREPSHFDAAAIEGTDHRTIIAIENDRVIAAGSVSSRARFVNGRPMRVGYLSGLRLAAFCRGRTSVIRRGYELLHRLHQDNGPPIYLTSIVADNQRARRLLERGLEGMPAYGFLGEFVTLVISRRRCSFRASGLNISSGNDGVMPLILDLLRRTNAQYQFAPAYSADDVRLPGLCPENFRVACTSDGEPVACAAIWDQRSIKQTVVRAYSTRLQRMRPFINVAAALTGRPRLPAIGEPISNAFISHLAGDPARTRLIESFVDLVHGLARTRRIDYLTIGFDARDPRLTAIRKIFRAREYVSRLYAVHWDDDGAELARNLEDRLLAPEVALL